MPDLIAQLPTDRIYKLLRGPEWQALQQQGQTCGSADDERDGYVHLSTAGQLPGTLERYYAETPEVWLLALDPVALGAALRWEPSRGGMLFPHLYGPLRLADCAVVAMRTSVAAGWLVVAGCGRS